MLVVRGKGLSGIFSIPSMFCDELLTVPPPLLVAHAFGWRPELALLCIVNTAKVSWPAYPQ